MHWVSDHKFRQLRSNRRGPTSDPDDVVLKAYFRRLLPECGLKGETMNDTDKNLPEHDRPVAGIFHPSILLGG